MFFGGASRWPRKVCFAGATPYICQHLSPSFDLLMRGTLPCVCVAGVTDGAAGSAALMRAFSGTIRQSKDQSEIMMFILNLPTHRTYAGDERLVARAAGRVPVRAVALPAPLLRPVLPRPHAAPPGGVAHRGRLPGQGWSRAHACSFRCCLIFADAGPCRLPFLTVVAAVSLVVVFCSCGCAVLLLLSRWCMRWRRVGRERRCASARRCLAAEELVPRRAAAFVVRRPSRRRGVPVTEPARGRAKLRSARRGASSRAFRKCESPIKQIFGNVTGLYRRIFPTGHTVHSTRTK